MNSSDSEKVHTRRNCLWRSVFPPFPPLLLSLLLTAAFLNHASVGLCEACVVGQKLRGEHNRSLPWARAHARGGRQLRLLRIGYGQKTTATASVWSVEVVGALPTSALDLLMNLPSSSPL